jgi:poly(3-hydroxybutyrate) depolymerase
VTPQAPTGHPSTFEGRNPAELSTLLNGLLSELCIDQRQMFAVGNGSGGRFLIKWVDYMARRDGPRFRAAAVVGTYYGNNLQGPLPTLFIHGTNSENSAGVAQDADGTKALAIFRTRNACGESTTPATVAGCTGPRAAVNPGCVDFDDCAAPLRWCQTDDPITSSGGELWPCFSGAAILEFFAR